MLFSVLKLFLRRATAFLVNIPIAIYVMLLVGFLLAIGRPIPDWLIEREKEIIKKKEALPDPYPLIE